MKLKVIFYLFFATFLTISLMVKSQSISSQDNLNLDYLWLNQFDIKPRSSQNISNSILMNESDFLLKFGLIQNANPDYSEELDTNMNHYFSNGFDVWFLDNILQAMEMTSSDYVFHMTNGSIISVGDNINTVATLFPESWLNKDDSGKIFVCLKNNSIDIDMNLTFQYNINTNLITKISVQ